MIIVAVLSEGECCFLPLGHKVTRGRRVCRLCTLFLLLMCISFAGTNFWSEESYKISRDKIQKSDIREKIGVLCESRMKRITTLCRKNLKFLNVTAFGTYSYH